MEMNMMASNFSDLSRSDGQTADQVQRHVPREAGHPTVLVIVNGRRRPR
jgi:hypothetical protein